MTAKTAITRMITSAFALLLYSNATLAAGEITAQRLIEADKEPQNWLTYGGTYNAWRYSPLDQINRKNVKNLLPAWVFQTGVVEGGFSCTPLIADGVMYITTAWNRVFALDTVTGKELWHYYHPVPKEILKDIVLPDALVPQSGQLFELTTHDGEQLEVVRMGESTTRIKVYVVSTLPPVLRSIKKDQVLSLQPKHRSAMPQTYGQHYTLKQLLDIISFLKSGGSGAPTHISLQDLF
jgi:outer membrane protein assembly factor BamB